jgi:hypothetical protein
MAVGETGGNEYRYDQIDEPVKPFTTFTPKLAAVRAVCFIASAARAFTPLESPSPQMEGDKIALWRSSTIVGNRLSGQMVGNGVELKAVIGEDLLLRVAIRLVGGAAFDIEVVAPAGEFESIEAHLFGAGRKFGERQIGPLAGEEGNWSCHNFWLSRSGIGFILADSGAQFQA